VEEDGVEVEVVLEEVVVEVAMYQEVEVLHKENQVNQMINEKSLFENLFKQS
jgi:hypothetical protein